MNQGPDKVHLRIVVLGMVFLALIVALVLRLWFLQVLSVDSFRKLADQNFVRVVPKLAARGRILDRNGQVLVDNRQSLVVTVDRSLVAKTVNKGCPTGLKNCLRLTPKGTQTMNNLAALLKVPAATLLDKLQTTQVGPLTPAPVATDVTKDQVVYLEEHQDLFPGVSYDQQPLREYPNGSLAAHALGTVGVYPTATDRKSVARYNGYSPGTIIGRGGVEYAYEQYLHGTDGYIKYQVDATGNVRGVLGTRDPTPGSDLVTTIDKGVQTLAEAALGDGLAKARTIYDKVSNKDYAAPAGGVVVMDPNNGQIVAMASSPTYDPTQFSVGISSAQYAAEFQNNPAQPLIDRVTQAQYPPGSTFKVVTAAAAMTEGFANPNGGFACPSQVRLYDQTFNNWQASDSGTISLQQALIQSCDTVFYNFGQTFYQRFRSGQGEQLQSFARNFGLGSATGIEIPGENAGRVPDAEWVNKMHKLDPINYKYGWLPGFTIQMAIGQGDLLVTPLQLADAYAAIANGGSLYQPELGLKVLNVSQTVTTIAPKVVRQLPVSPQALAVIRTGLQGVAVQQPLGTAEQAFAGFPFDKVSVAAKTGTADIAGKQPYAWFATYAPADHPQYLVVVMLEQAGHGGETAAPIARRILEGLFNLPATNIAPAAKTD
jgi:penicillin-binding protein 2